MAIPSGEIYLLNNVILSRTYEHTIDFKNRNEQYGYFRSFIKYTLTNYTYLRKEREYLAVELPLNALDDINYMIFRSAEDERLYYAFVTDKTYLNPHTTNVYFEIDVMQTFQFDYDWRASYIVQAHVDRWTAEHKPIYSKTDEGLNYGTEYSVESAYTLRQHDNVRWFLVTMKDYTPLLQAGKAYEVTAIKPIGAPFSYFLIPVAYRQTEETKFFVNDQEIATFKEFNDLMLRGALGNYVHSINLLTYNPFIETEINPSLGGYHITLKPNVICDYAHLKNIRLLKKALEDGGFKEFFEELGNIETPFLVITNVSFSNWRQVLARSDWDIGLNASLPSADEWKSIKENPYTTPHDKRFESKLLCAPYRYNMLCDWKNEPIVFKNEYMTTDKIEIYFSFALSSNAPARYWLKDYKKDPEGRYTSLVCPISSQMPIISDAYYTYMLENKNTIEANLTNAKINAVSGAVSGAISGGGVGGVGGAIFGGVTGAINGALNVQAQIRSENAKQADLKMRPDSIIASNDSVFNMCDLNTEVTFYRMRICCENEEIIANIFHMSGYKVNRVEIPNTKSRLRFNYIQTVGANLVGSISQYYLSQIKEIYDKGVTIWHYTEKDFNPLDYSYENMERNLL